MPWPSWASLSIIAKTDPGHFITQSTEHSAVLESFQELEHRGHEVTYLEVDHLGLVSPETLKNAIREDTVLVSIMHANNEIGTIQPIAELGDVCQDARVMFHVDASQTCGLLSVNVRDMQASLVSFSGHKMYGPKGVGALYVRRRGPRVQLKPEALAAGMNMAVGQGSLNVPGIVGLGHAAKLAKEEMVERYGYLMLLRQRLEEGLAKAEVAFSINGAIDSRLPHNSSITFHGVSAEDLILECRALAMSASAACSSAEKAPSHVILALGKDAGHAASTIRFGLGKDLRLEDVDRAVEILTAACRKLSARR